MYTSDYCCTTSTPFPGRTYLLVPIPDIRYRAQCIVRVFFWHGESDVYPTLATLARSPLAVMDQCVLEDGTLVGENDESGRSFAQAIRRMHAVVGVCDKELADVSAAMQHGRASVEYKDAAQRFQKCQERRIAVTSAIETRCGSSQETFKDCVAERGEQQAHACLPLLEAFIACAMHAVQS